MAEINYMDPGEFQEGGYLHEINRLLLHPLGLALEMSTTDRAKGAFIARVWDYRDDPEGMVFGDDLLNSEKATKVCEELLARRDERKKHTGGWIIQPLPDHQVLSTTYTDPEATKAMNEAAGMFAGVEIPEDAEHCEPLPEGEE